MNKRIKKYPCDYTVVDIETTGFSYYTEYIIELSAIKVRNDKVIDKYSKLIKPPKHLSSFITRLTGIDDDMLKDELSIEEELLPFIEFVGDDLIIGHNVRFDIGFINYFANELYGLVFDNKYLDTMFLSKQVWFNERHHKLTNLIERCNLDCGRQHRGLNDCMYTYEAYLYMKKLLKDNNND